MKFFEEAKAVMLSRHSGPTKLKSDGTSGSMDELEIADMTSDGLLCLNISSNTAPV